MDSAGHDETGADPGAGVFGNLPTSRPGTRSPRRKSSAAAEQPPAEHPPEPPNLDPIADAERVAAATAPPRRTSETGPAPDPAASGREAEEEAGDDSPAGLGDLAWAGVAVAADAATIGVRLASRALERLRDGVDPR